MRLGFGRILLRPLASGLACGAIIAFAVALRIAERQEAWTSRTATVVALALIGGTMGGFSVSSIMQAATGTLSRALRFAGAAALAGPALLGFTWLAFAGWLLLFRHAETDTAPGLLSMDLIELLLDALGYLVTTGAPYFLPWPVPAFAVATGLLAALGSSKADAVEVAPAACYRRALP